MSYSKEKFTLNSFEGWMMQYYINQDEAVVLDAIIFASLNEKLNDEKLRPICLSFFSSVFRENNNIYKNLTLDRFKKKKQKYYFVNILYLTNTADSLNLLKRFLKETNDKNLINYINKLLNNPFYIFSLKIKNAVHLDMLWGTFFGSGKSEPIIKIIKALNLQINGHGFDIVIGKSAEWSLKSNAKHHKKVYDIIRQEIKNKSYSNGIKKILIKIISEIDNQKSETTTQN